MTRETKIGLLVGLAFIILFAIILSEKGDTRGTQPPSGLTVVDANRSTGGPLSNNQEPLSRAGRLPVKPAAPQPTQMARHDADVPTMLEEPVGKPIPAEDEAIMPLPEAVRNRLNMPMIETEVAVNQPGTEAGGSMSLTQALTSALEGAGSASSDAAVDDTGMAEPITPDMTQASMLEAPPAKAPQAAPPKSMKTIAIHTVRPRESLSKIAARYYGRSTPARVAAIFNANRDRLKSIGTIRVGQELNIPQLDELQGIAFQPVTHFAPSELPRSRSTHREMSVRIPVPLDAQAAPTAPPIASAKRAEQAHPASRAFRWYQVREKDTLSRIAKRELGDEKRFLEIYRMNQDIIRNKHRIKPGMKIRLPVRTVTRAGSDAAALSGLVPSAIRP